MTNTPTPNASYSLTLRVKIHNKPGQLGKITTAIGGAGGDIEGIEVYTGASDVPGEFAGSNSACGTVVIWTKSAPPRPARP